MSGPIVRKYGFPNFEEIFGKRELEHGVDEPATSSTPPEPQEAPKVVPKATAKPKGKKRK